ncbi:hypothetical protein OPV22_032645 [Ensete ventricosum]|uniref:DUF632 domain-containing protein n=1 Tax=Ensete ventricosum TaxID=4639 RepID=A0AAV8PZT6_ENSVE|nr:hypothetical protein OPV22_032645 [Ensete ventricosum]
MQEGMVLQKGLGRAVTAKEELGGVKSDSELEGTLKSKILRLRHNLDLPHPNASLTLHEVLLQFYKLLKLAGDLWVKKCCKSEKMAFEEADVEVLNFEQLGAVVLNKLDCMNIHMKEMFDLMKKDSASPLKSEEDLIKPGHHDKPQSPTSVLPEPSEVNRNRKGSQNIAYLPPLLHPLRLQAVGKLKPLGLKRLSFHLFPLVLDHRSKAVTQTENITDELELDSLDATMVLKPISYAESRSDSHADESETYEDITLVSTPPASSSLPSNMFESSTPGTLQPTCTEQVLHAVNTNWDEDDSSKTSDSTILVPPTLPILRMRATHLSPTPTPPPSPMVLTGIPWFFGSPRQSGMEMEPVAYAMAIDDSGHVCTCEPSETSFKASDGRKSQTGNCSDGKKSQGMADALAEMTKRSAYFRKIEEDVEKHSASIMKLRSSINSFETKET